MIEVARYILALIVALTHLQPLGMGRPGSIAVFAFYTLSGYLMTRVLNERYGFTARGSLFYFHSRSLRGWINANWRALIVLLAAALAATFLGNAISATVGPYLGIGVMFCLLSAWNGQSGNSTQDFFGRASYHLFIGHMPIAAILVTGLKFRQGSVFVFLAAVIVAFALSVGLAPVERNINVMRQRIAKMRKPYGEGALPAEG